MTHETTTIHSSYTSIIDNLFVAKGRLGKIKNKTLIHSILSVLNEQMECFERLSAAN